MNGLGKTCAECGANLAPDSPRGLCPQCLLKAGLASDADSAPALGSETGPTGTMVTPSPPPGSRPSATRHPPLNSPPSTPSTISHVRYFGDYELLEEIGSGGMGVVYKARQVNLKRLVALKMILRGRFAGTSEVKRFQAEAEAVANLNHPNIVTIYEVGLHEGHHYLAMELVEGPTLAQLVEQKRWGSDQGKAALLVAKVARAVHHAHAQGILHRDLKPGNILIDKQGEPHVADFGLARRLGTESGLTVEGAVMGTPSFMAPEQAAGKTKQLDAAADIYSLGAILYYLLTGRPPFAAESTMDILVQVLEGEAIRPRTIDPRISVDLEGICLRCLEKSAPLRYASAAALADDLERYLRGENVGIRPQSLVPLLKHWVRQQPALCSHLGGLAVCAVIAQAGFSFQEVVPLSLHLKIMSLLGLWAVLSVFYQLGLRRERWEPAIRFLWCGTDVSLLTVLLWINHSATGPLLALYPALITASGLWFRVSLVFFTTAMSCLGYSSLLWHEYRLQGRLEQYNWHLIVMVTLLNIGLVVAYQVHRVRALSRFYEHRPFI